MSGGRAGLTAWAPALPGALLVGLAWAAFGTALVDDAYISLTYARSLAEGHGLVFHPALPPAEGYSNLLWTLLLAGAMGLGAHGARAAVVLGLLCAAGAVALVARRVGGRAGALTGLAIAASPVFGYWAGRGLEGGLLALLLTYGVCRLGSERAWLAFGLIGVTRVEGLAYGLLPLVHQALARPGERRWPTRRALALWLGPAAAQLALRLWAYGAPLPSTAVAKSTGGLAAVWEKGLPWLGQGLMLELGLSAALMVAVAVAARDRARDHTLGASALAVLGIAAYSVAVGGDWMPANRWLQPAIPAAWLAVALGLASRPRLRLIALSLGILVSLRPLGERSDDEVRRDWGRALTAARTGAQPVRVHPAHRFVVEWLPESEVVLMPDVGMLAWVTGNPVLDPQGLTWREAAEMLGEDASGPVGAAGLEGLRQTVERLDPALIGLVVEGAEQRPRGPVARALLGGGAAKSWFLSRWSAWKELPYGGGNTLVLYLRRTLPRLTPLDQLARLRAASARVPEALALRRDLVLTLRQLGQAEEAARLAREPLGADGASEARWTP